MERYECSNCEGKGCDECNQTGFLDWIEKVVGVKPNELKRITNLIKKEINSKCENFSFKLNDEVEMKLLEQEINQSLSNFLHRGIVRDYSTHFDHESMTFDVHLKPHRSLDIVTIHNVINQNIK